MYITKINFKNSSVTTTNKVDKEGELNIEQTTCYMKEPPRPEYMDASNKFVNAVGNLFGFTKTVEVEGLNILYTKESSNLAEVEIQFSAVAEGLAVSGKAKTTYLVDLVVCGTELEKTLHNLLGEVKLYLKGTRAQVELGL